MLYVQSKSVGRSLSASNDEFVCDTIIPFPNKPLFSCVCSSSLLKTLLEKEKFACNKQFSPFPKFSCHLKNFQPFSSNLKLSSAKSFSLDESKICL